MAFKLALSETYKVKVVVETPNEYGKTSKDDFVAEFKRVGMDELEELRKLPQPEVFERVLVGWSGLLDGDNQAVPFSELNRKALLNIPQALAGLMESYWPSVFKAREKN